MNQNWIWKISIINFANRGEKTKTTARIFNQKYCWATARNCTDAVLSTPLTSWRCTENYSQGIISTKNYVLQLSTAQALKQVFFPLSLSHSCSVVLSHSLNMGGGETYVCIWTLSDNMTIVLPIFTSRHSVNFISSYVPLSLMGPNLCPGIFSYIFIIFDGMSESNPWRCGRRLVFCHGATHQV